MSILIKGMEMPSEGEYHMTLYVCSDGSAYIDVASFPVDEDRFKAVHVPPHGRLIDADTFAAEMKKRQDACAEWRDDIKSGGGYGTELYYRADSFLGAMCETKLTLDKIPTIIPAEEGE